MVERVEELIPESKWRRAYRDITEFERTIADDGTLIIKFFLHISKQEQRLRFDKLLKDPLTAWQVSDEDWEHHHNYDKWLLAYEEAFERTDTEFGPWTIVEATNRRYTRVKIFQTVIIALEERLDLALQPLPTLYELELMNDATLTDTDSDFPDLVVEGIPEIETLAVGTPVLVDVQASDDASEQADGVNQVDKPVSETGDQWILEDPQTPGQEVE